MKIQIFTVILISLAVTSCLDDLNEESIVSSVHGVIELTPEEYTSISNDYIYDLSDEEVYEIISEFEKLSKDAKTRSVGQSKVFIREKESLTGSVKGSINTRSDLNVFISTTIVTVEIVNDRNSDLAIIGIDSRSPKVIAYIGNGTKCIFSEELNFLISVSKEKHLNDIALVEEIKESLRESTINRLCEDLNVSKEDFSFNGIRDRIIINSITGRTRAMESNGLVGMPPRVKSWIGPIADFDWSPHHFNQYIEGGRNHYYWSESITSNGIQRSWRYGHVPLSHSIMTLAKAVAIAQPWVHPVDKDYKLMSGIKWPWIKETPGPVWNLDGDEIMGWGEKWPVMNGFMHLLYIHSRSSLVKDSQGIVVRMITPNDGMIAMARELIHSQKLPYYDWNVAKSSLDNIRPVILYGTMERTNKMINGINERYDCSILIDGYAICDAGGGVLGSTINYLHTNTGFGPALANVWFLVPTNMEVEMKWENDEGFYSLNTSQMSMMHQIYDDGFSYYDSRLWDYYGPQDDRRDPDPGVLEPWDEGY